MPLDVVAPGKLILALGNTEGLKIWLDGKVLTAREQVLLIRMVRQFEFGQTQVAFHLRAMHAIPYGQITEPTFKAKQAKDFRNWPRQDLVRTPDLPAVNKR